MLWIRINREKAETCFITCRNVAGATITAGYAVVLDITSSVNGNRVTKPATATLSLFMGLMSEDCVDSAYKLVQAYGYRASGFVTNDTSQAIAAGDILIPVNGQHYLARSAASDGKTGFAFAAEAFATATTPAAAQKKVFLRSL